MKIDKTPRKSALGAQMDPTHLSHTLDPISNVPFFITQVTSLLSKDYQPFLTGLNYAKSSQVAQCHIAAALLIATSIPVTNLRQYINSDLDYNGLKFQLLCSKIATVNSFEVAISNGLCFLSTKFYFFEPNVLWK